MLNLNRKEYTDTNLIKSVPHTEYFNLNIYPILNQLETEAGLLSDLAEACGNLTCDCTNIGNPNEINEFIYDNLLNFKNIYTNYSKITESKYHFIRIDEFIDNTFAENLYSDVILSNENDIFNKKYSKRIKIKNLSKILYLTEEIYPIFEKHFKYYFEEDIFNYSNLICYCMIIKNGGPLLEEVLTTNLKFIDRWCILDTGSTDGSQEIIRRVLKDKKGILFEEPFVDFKVSRNRCLELAGKSCKFLCMLDDTYTIEGDLKSFLEIVRGDQFSDSFSLMIKSDDTEYYSNRIIKSTTELRYIHTIHEVITDQNNINVTIPSDKVFILDHRAEYMEQRTNDRKQFDLQLLFKEVEDDPNDPRALYYIAQTYGCIGDEINKAKYFELRIAHPVQGYVQEKIDALFELARTYNFKVNSITKEYLTSPLSETQWKRCEELYLSAWELDKNRPDSLYFIGIKYYLEQNYQIAYKYFKLGFETGYPIGSQYSLKPTLSYHFLPKFLTEICYYLEDYQLGLSAAQLFLTNYNTQSSDSWNLINNWYGIHNNLVNMGPISQTPAIQGKFFCIVTDGGWEPWTGKDILTKGLGGSETWIVETARNIKNFNVVVFCKTEKPEVFENVGYNPIELFPQFCANNVIEICIISRFPEYVPVAIKGHAKHIGIIFHDLLSPEVILPKDSKLKWIFGLTDWHCEYLKKCFPMYQDIILKSNYGIDQNFKSEIKVKNSFIYSSFPNRGLVVLLRMWPRILEILPDATLNIFCNLEQTWVNNVIPEEMKEIKALLKVNKKGTTVHGWVPKKVLAQAWSTAEYFLYPCKFEETFCLTAVEAAITKTFVITNGLAALGETVGDRGLIIPGNVLDISWQDECIHQIKTLTQEFKETKIAENYEWATDHSWKSQTDLFISKLKIEKNMLNWTNDVPHGTRQSFDYALSLLPKESTILEIGVYLGTSIIEILKIVPDSTAVVIDQWKEYHEHDNLIGIDTTLIDETTEALFYKNIIEFKDRIKVLKGNSSDKLLELLMKQVSFNFIYVDASHKCLDVYLDAMLAWKLLKIGGFMAFDDYRFNKGDILNSPYEAIEHFKRENINNFVLIKEDYRVYLKKIN